MKFKKIASTRKTLSDYKSKRGTISKLFDKVYGELTSLYSNWT